MRMRLIVAILLICGLLIIGSSLQTNPAERIESGNTLHAQDNFEAALHAYQAAQVNAPDSPVAYYNAASALASIGRLRDAVAALAQALKNSDDELTFKAYYNLGNVLYEMALYNDAVDVYRQAIRLNPADDDARHNYELASSFLS